jgi:hypothetical protein
MRICEQVPSVQLRRGRSSCPRLAPRHTVAALAILLVLMLVGCAPSNASPVSPAPPSPGIGLEPTSSVTSVTGAAGGSAMGGGAAPSSSPSVLSEPAVEPTATALEITPGPGLLKRHDIPPNGVQAEEGHGGGGGCGAGGPMPGESTPPQPIEIGHHMFICFQQFGPFQPATMVITTPNGTAERETVVTDQQGAVERDWFALPEKPPGKYQFALNQGSLYAQSTLVLSAATAPAMLIYPTKGPPGTTFRIVLVGFPDRVSVRLYFYEHGEYITGITPTQVNAEGRADIMLPTALDDPVGFYSIWTGRRFNLFADFELSH